MYVTSKTLSGNSAMATLLRGLLLVEVVARCVQSTSFKVLWMAPETAYNGLQAGSSIGAFKLAMESINTSDTFDLKYKDSDCNSRRALTAVYDVIIKDKWRPDVIIGPPCSTAMVYVAQVSGYRNVSVVGWVSDSPDFGKKDTYNTLIRILPPINVIGKGLLQTLNKFNWKRAFLLSCTGYPYDQLGTAVNEVFKDEEYTITRWMQDEAIDPDENRINEIYKMIRKEARIVILAVPLTTLRLWMIQASVNDMTDGDYVFIYLNGELTTDRVLSKLKSDVVWKANNGDDKKALDGAENLLILTPRSYHPDSTFEQAADEKGKNDAPDLNLTYAPTDQYAPYLYDAVKVYVHLTQQVSNYEDGNALYEKARRLYLSGADYKTSPILLDENADRLPDFLLLDLSDSGSFVDALAIEWGLNASKLITTTVRSIRPVVWGDGSSGMANAPPDVPVCGFLNELCPVTDLVPLVVPPVVIGLIVITGLVAYFVNRKLQFERSLKDMGWKLNPNDLKKSKNQDHLTIMLAGSRASSIQRSRASGIGSHQTDTRSLSHASVSRKSGATSVMSNTADDHSQIFVNVVKYKGSMVAVKKIRKPRIKLDRELLVEMTAMVNLKNHSLARFIGATTEPPEILEVWEYCSKGSLQDVIWNDNIKFEDIFKYSVAIDLFKGLKYLHDSPVKIHGRLKSSNCVIDGRWTCKLTDYGLVRLREGAQDDPDLTDFAKQSRLLWTAPELLRKMEPGYKVTGRSQEADIYAGAIILKEIFARNGPYTEYEDDMEPHEILAKVKQVPDGTFLPFRPSFSELKGRAPDKLLEVIKRGWSEKPSDRPSASHMVKDLQRINPNKSANVMDNMIRMMERYTNHLEEIVNERTQQVEEEKKKSEMLLYRMLPRPIAEALKKGSSVQAQSYDSVSLYFSDIVKFTALSAQSTPMQVVDLLNGLYTMFDSAIANHDVYKVETIGDAYMLVSGLPQKNGDRHAAEIANCAMDLLSGITGFKVKHMPDDYVLRIRIGLHTGPAVAGVVGLAMPRYCLFGNTITIAQTMESGGQPMRIQMSQFTYDILKTFAGYYLAARNDPIEVKGLGKINTYWLINREGYDKPMPDFGALSAEDCPQPVILPVTTGKVFRPSVSESGVFDLDADDNKQLSRKTSAVGPELEHISENGAGPQQVPNHVTHDPDAPEQEVTDRIQSGDDGVVYERMGRQQTAPSPIYTSPLPDGDVTPPGDILGPNLERPASDPSDQPKPEVAYGQQVTDEEGIYDSIDEIPATAGEHSWVVPSRSVGPISTSGKVSDRPSTATLMRSRFKVSSSLPENSVVLMNLENVDDEL